MELLTSNLSCSSLFQTKAPLPSGGGNASHITMWCWLYKGFPQLNHTICKKRKRLSECECGYVPSVFLFTLICETSWQTHFQMHSQPRAHTCTTGHLLCHLQPSAGQLAPHTHSPTEEAFTAPPSPANTKQSSEMSHTHTHTQFNQFNSVLFF